MAKNEKKVSISSLDNVVKEQRTEKIVDTWHDIEVTVKPSISFTETLEFANDVTMSCFSDENGFVPEVMDFAIKSNILSKYANFSLPDNLEHRHEIIYNTDAVQFVCQRINMEQLREITASIDRKIAYLCNSNIMGIQRQMTELIGAFEKMQQSTAEMFSNITPEDMIKVIGALDNGAFNEEKLASAYLAQTKPADTPAEDRA